MMLGHSLISFLLLFFFGHWTWFIPQGVSVMGFHWSFSLGFYIHSLSLPLFTLRPLPDCQAQFPCIPVSSNESRRLGGNLFSFLFF